ncbi:Do family serine endopeptidase [Altericroceibacterium spongiae]|uniref:Probable periplasmic serine endoprotease DegP-like n=1 Tax=Altericroceibacterium spongiae TaxID=2320269 RepID=A0A420EQ36_9SPHN|nr:Do family serine endopeptidase [Altericroceibacterium spongiae]
MSLITGYPAGAQVAQNDAQHMQQITPRAGAPSSFADLTEQLQPAVVNIATRQRVTVNNNPFSGTPFAELFGNRGRPTTREAQSLGSGFIVSADGYVVTNNHVIAAEGHAEVEEITVSTPDGTEYPAELVGRDAASDLAVLKISRDKPFPFVKFGDSSQARVGDWVIAIGNPFGLGGTVTAGIISAVYRNTGSAGAYDRYIQTDASINRGNSGGPLFDMQGNVIGINNAIFSPSGGSVGIGFAIPAETASPIVKKLMAGEEIKRGYLGVLIGPVSEDMAEALDIPENHGEFIQSVTANGPADKAGIQPGDVVMKVDGKDVTPDQTLSFLVANIEPGTRVPVQVIRDGKRQTLNISVGERPSEEELAQQTFDPDSDDLGPPQAPSSGQGVLEDALGLHVIPLNPQITRQLGVSSDTQGVVITAVDPSSDAGQKGLQRGDILLTANYQRLTSVEDLENVVKTAQDQDREAVLLRVQRRGRPAQFVPIRLKESD